MAATRWASDDPDDDLADAYLGIVQADRSWRPDGGADYGSWLYEGACLRIHAGRWDRRGSGARAMRAAGQRYLEPLSLQHVVAEPNSLVGRGILIEDFVEAPPLVDLDPDRTDVDTLDSLFDRLTDREWVMVTRTAREAAAELGIKRASVHRARVRLYARLRAEYGIDAPDSSDPGTGRGETEPGGSPQQTSEAA